LAHVDGCTFFGFLVVGERGGGFVEWGLAMPTGQTTLAGSGSTPMVSVTSPLRGMDLIFQNNSAHAIRVGDDARVSVTTPAAVNGGTAGFGLLLQPGGSSGGALATSGAFNVKNWYIAGTATDVIDWQFTPEE
jgi:hypothetical protein